MVISVTTQTPPADNCLTLTEVKNYLKVDQSAEDSLIASQLDAAESLVESYTNRKLMKGVYDLTLDSFPANGIVLPFSPVISVDSISYYDESNVLQAWTNYKVNVSAQPTKIEYINGYPGVYSDRQDKVIVRFTAGYSNSSDTATQQAAAAGQLKMSILRLCGDLYAVRQDQVREKFTSWMQLAYPERVWHFPNENE